MEALSVSRFFKSKSFWINFVGFAALILFFYCWFFAGSQMLYKDDRLRVYSDSFVNSESIKKVVGATYSLLDSAFISDTGTITIILTSNENTYSRKRFYRSGGSLAGNYLWLNMIVFR
ncbi:MAG: hypothetical protein J6Z12_03925, partial [Paludibacteraceae bacterium]|nr:hypothetical protein [Paludibacteraceae bacterium]